MMDAYLRELSAELRRRGVPPARRRRLLAETEDHLRSDVDALSRFGDAATLAQRCADELAAMTARRMSFTAFAALAVAGMVFGAVLLATFTVAPARTLVCCSQAQPLQALTVGLLVVAPQVAFVAGLLALIRAFRLRGVTPLPAKEVRLLRRRTATAIVSGVAAMCALALFALEYGTVLPGWAAPVAIAGAAVSGALLLGVALAAAPSMRVRVQASGDAGDLFADIGSVVPIPLRGRAWAFAVVVALGLALVVFAPGVAADDPYDAAIRATAEALACLAGFAVLGRFLGLRAQRSTE